MPEKTPEREIVIRLKPWQLVRHSLFLVLFVLVFLLGRWSVDAPDTDLSGFFVADAEEEETDEEEEAQAEAEAPLREVTSAAPTVEEEEVAEATLEAPKAEAVNESGPTLTTYTKVDVEVVDVITEWKGTWGKIIRVQYKIKNSEAVIIHPDHFELTVEGYGDFAKTIALPPSSQTLKSGEIRSSVGLVKNGFAYSELTTGNLQEVDVTLTLFDKYEQVMGKGTKAFNLKG